MTQPDFSVFIEPVHFKLIISLFDDKYSRDLCSSVGFASQGKAYMSLIRFNMAVSLLRGCGYGEVEKFDTALFQELSKHKRKIHFEFLVDYSCCQLRLTNLIYDERPDRMGIIIKKSILRTSKNHGFNIKFQESFSKQMRRSFFYFQ